MVVNYTLINLIYKQIRAKTDIGLLKTDLTSFDQILKKSSEI